MPFARSLRLLVSLLPQSLDCSVGVSHHCLTHSQSAANVRHAVEEPADGLIGSTLAEHCDAVRLSADRFGALIHSEQFVVDLVLHDSDGIPGMFRSN